MLLKLFLALAFATMLCGASETLIAYWDFTSGKIDSVDDKIKMRFLGSTRIVGDEKTGKCLAVGITDKDSPEGISSFEIHPELSPASGFRLEVRFRLRKQTSKQPFLRFFDTKNINYSGKNPDWHKGFLFQLVRAKNPDNYSFEACLGFGNFSKSAYGTCVELEPGRIYTASVEYNGTDQITFRLDGKINRDCKLEKIYGPIAKAVNRVVIGDRIGSTWQRFDGDIFDVKLYAVDRKIALSVDGRRAFYRNEKHGQLEVEIFNKSKNLLEKATLKAILPDGTLELVLALPATGKSTVCRFPIETRLEVGKYPSQLILSYNLDGKPAKEELRFELLICPIEKDIMPVECDIGGDFRLPTTHTLVQLSPVFTKYNGAPEQIIENFRLLDSLMFQGYKVWDLCFPGCLPKFQNQYRRVGRDGNPYLGNTNLDASNPEVRKIIAGMIRQTAETFGRHPVFCGASINSEVRDNTLPSFHNDEVEAFRKYSGFDIPEEVKGKLAPSYFTTKGFPISRVVKKDFPLLVYYTWFWSRGDGWNPMQTLISDVYRKNIPHDFATEHRPAVRVPPLWGSGGNVTALAHWTYAYPDPINIGANTSELQAMAEGGGQNIRTMTTLICYRSLSAPIGVKVKNEPAWVKDCPHGEYITLAPDLLMEALWTQISRHITGITFHGYDAIIKRKVNLAPSYHLTNQETKKALNDVLEKVVRPLGPLLKRVKERPAEVAIFESFPATIFAGRGSWGWYGWIFDSNLMLQWANLAPHVVYEEKILRDGFGKIKVLFMPHCDILSEPLFNAITDFQKRGGLVVSDQFHVPGLLPDFIINQITRSKGTETDKRNFQMAGLALRKQLEAFYTPYTAASNPDLVTWVRSDKNADCLFIINDSRTFGNYFGQYGLVMEKGMPNKGMVTIRRNTGAVYDLVKNCAVPFTSENGITTIPVHFTTNDGRLFLLLPNPVAKVVLDIPASVKRGSSVELKMRVIDSSGKAVDSIHPIGIDVKDTTGRTTDDTTYAVLENGVYSAIITPPLNAKPGYWTVTVQDLASGKTVKKNILVEDQQSEGKDNG
ncbi:MAG: hypothetical protein BWY31_03867 [Lentisphaerae bacterium ADurb.Bin242]|nr:MAG: hypothetical protein BWY31_03867 [Lentisphaerae bacterium ADurb.Bin242]